MVTDKLKQFIFKQLYKELGNVEIIPYKDSIWFIDRENIYWYFQLSKEGCLFWRYSFFPSFFSIFSLEQSEFEPIISSWVEEVLNSNVSTTDSVSGSFQTSVEEVLNHKVSTTKMFVIDEFNMVEEVLNSKVSTTVGFEGLQRCGVEEILDYKISETFEVDAAQKRKVKKVLDSRVSTTGMTRAFSNDTVEKVLNNKKENESK